MRRWLAGALLVTVGWLASPTSVPVYDGKSPAPTTASDTAAVSHGSVGALQVKSGEVGPQLLIDLAPGALRSTTTSKVTVTGTPVKPDGTPPRGSFDGNAYRITAAPAVTLSPDQSGYLFLRAAVMTSPAPVVVHRSSPAAPWREVSTQRAGRDILATGFKELGDYAVVRLPGAKPVDSGGIGLTRVLFLGGGVLLLVAVTVLVLRRPRPEDDDEA
jgi:hypothetical protein